LALIRAKGIEPKVVEYLKNPPGVAEIRAVLKEMGRIGPRELLRRRGTPYDNLDLINPRRTDSELVAAMATHPMLIERPVVRTRRDLVMRLDCSVESLLADLQSVMRIARSAKLLKKRSPGLSARGFGASRALDF